MRALQLNILAVLLTLASSGAGATVERPELTTLELQYGDKAPLKLYANSKYSIRILGFPTEAHVAQVMPRLRTDFLDLHILGDRSLEVGTDRAASIDFGLQIPVPHKKAGSSCSTDPNSESSVCSREDYINYGELRIKSFTKTGENAYTPYEDYIIPVQTKFCIESNPVCGMLKGTRATYSDSCKLEQAGAEHLYEGSCQ